MTPDDPRHGTPAGYQTHWRAAEAPCGPCSDARFKARKRTELDRLSGVRTAYTRSELDEVLAPWLALGIGMTAISAAAGLGSSYGPSFASRDSQFVRRSTFLTLQRMTEDDLLDGSKVWADLTRTRIWSLMAAGHRVIDMPVNPRGPWRWRDKVTVAQARSVRDFYEDHQHTTGPNTNGRARALNAGHRPPAAWDDPGTLAWPLGWFSALGEAVEEFQDIDEVVVEKVLAGTPVPKTNRAERVEIVRRWRLSDRSLGSLERLTGWKCERYYTPGSAPSVSAPDDTITVHSHPREVA